MAKWDVSDTLPVDGGTSPESLEDWPEKDASTRYIDQRLLGRGGMGEVWQAWDSRLRRRVAIKRTRPDGGTSLASRLMREARITAVLEHPGIVSVHDAGTDEDGQPWYAMEILRGRTLAKYLLDDPNAAGRQRLLRHVLAACEAAGFAHHAGVVHRDLKPDNIQIGAFGETQVLDWGLARPIDDDEEWKRVLSSVGSMSRDGAVLGTPGYMSPEQAAGDVSGPPGDVWSLGIVLYEVIAGRKAYVGRTGHEVLRKVLAGPPAPLLSVAPTVAPELLAIVSRALRDNPEERYPDATALARDLSAYLDGTRVSAHRYTTVDEVRRLLRVWQVPLLAAGTGLIGLLAAGAIGGVSVWQEKQRLQVAQQELKQALSDVDRRLGEALTQRSLLAFQAGDLGRAQLLAVSALEHREDADARGVLADASPHPRRLRRISVQNCATASLSPSGLVCVTDRGVRVIDEYGGERLVTRYSGDSLYSQPWSDHLLVRGPSGSLQPVNAGGERASGGPYPSRYLYERPGPSLVDGWFVSADPASIRVAGAPGEGEQRVDSDPCGGRVERVAVLGVDDVLVWCAGGDIRRGPLAAPPILTTIEGDHTPDSIAVDKAGTRAAFGEITGTVRVLDLESGQEVYQDSLGPARVERVALSADGMWLAAQVPGTGLQLIELSTGTRHHLPSQALNVAFHEDGHLRVLTPDALEVWQIPVSEAYGQVRFQSSGVVGLSWGDELAVACGSRTARVRPGAATDRLSLGAAQDRVKSAALLPDGRLLVGTLFGAFVDGGSGPEQLDRQQIGRRVLPMADGHMLVLGIPTWLWDTKQDRTALEEAFFASMEGAVAPGGHVAVAASRTGNLTRITLGDPVGWESLGEYPASAVAAGLDGWPVYLGTSVGMDVLDAAGVRSPWVVTGAQITDVAVSPDGRLVAAADTEQRAWVWRASDGQLLAKVRGHSRRVTALAFSPDGRWLATGSWDDTVRFWDVGRMEQPVGALREGVERSWGVSVSAEAPL